VPYRAAHRLQLALRERRITGAIDDDLLLLVEHEPTVTLGRGTKETSMPVRPAALEALGLTVAEVERGGDVTWHGPGQLVGYPILHLSHHREDLHWYLRQVEESLIRSLADLGIAGSRHPGHTGVWVAGRKIASIGVHVRQWVTTHGFALNVSNESNGFELIVPCGIAGVEMTSIRGELGGGDPTALWDAARGSVAHRIASVFGLDPVPAAVDDVIPGGLEAGPTPAQR
jgi:lipoate-protein ligase B